MLKGEGRVIGAKLWAIACLSDVPQLLLLSVLDQALHHDASIKPAEWLANWGWPVIGCVCGKRGKRATVFTNIGKRAAI